MDRTYQLFTLFIYLLPTPVGFDRFSYTCEYTVCRLRPLTRQVDYMLIWQLQLTRVCSGIHSHDSKPHQTMSGLWLIMSDVTLSVSVTSYRKIRCINECNLFMDSHLKNLTCIYVKTVYDNSLKEFTNMSKCKSSCHYLS